MAFSRQKSFLAVWVLAWVGAIATYASADRPSEQQGGSNQVDEKDQPGTAGDSPERAAARKQSQLMHNIYAATLEVMHHHYFHENKAILPARAMEDIFDELAETSNNKANWIAVNTKAMSVHHEPKTDFEIKAAAALRTGKEEFEAVENGYYYRAGPIPLGAGCVSCHTGFFSAPPKTPRLAGLIIGIPLEEK